MLSQVDFFIKVYVNCFLALKLGQAKDGGQGALESVTLGPTASDERVTTEDENLARRNAPHEIVNKDYAGTTYSI